MASVFVGDIYLERVRYQDDSTKWKLRPVVMIRALIQDMPAQHGATVVVSSQLLSEIDQMATHVGIHQGKLVFQRARRRDNPSSTSLGCLTRH